MHGLSPEIVGDRYHTNRSLRTFVRHRNRRDSLVCWGAPEGAAVTQSWRQRTCEWYNDTRPRSSKRLMETLRHSNREGHVCCLTQTPCYTRAMSAFIQPAGFLTRLVVLCVRDRLRMRAPRESAKVVHACRQSFSYPSHHTDPIVDSDSIWKCCVFGVIHHGRA